MRGSVRQGVTQADHRVAGLEPDDARADGVDVPGNVPAKSSEVASIVAGASQKMLTQTLRKLERDGLVERSGTASVPPRVDYELTRLGHDLLPLQRAIKSWAESHIEAVHAARARYDATE
ncbi:helix-turn-helix domain-containing protein [Actinopolymorpha pittospori]|uniref:DNA-binding HxlR family transcriptional regulator n=1 Tax=Actinopolymorpha pittospori TaxID=648752 RepID=A0A927RC87_9ACTN|nr:DNA-binding HxlR family transcriptional regulator [Actinopolymorpha pittospori]